MLDYVRDYPKVLTPKVVSGLVQIYTLKGRHSLYYETHADCFCALNEITMLQDVTAACRMDGVKTTPNSLKKVMHGGIPETPAEQEMAGYRDALISIRDPYRELFIDNSAILKYHGILYQYSETIRGGVFRDIGDPSAEDLPDILRRANESIPPHIPNDLNHVCVRYQTALNHHELEPLVLISMFLTDFFTVVPFARGNIRMFLLLIQLLLSRAAIEDWKYASIPSLIENSKEEFFAALKVSAEKRCRPGENYIPVAEYLMRIILKACRQVETQATRLMRTNWSKSERIRMYIRMNDGETTKAEIMKAFPEISQTTLERTLHEMLAKGEMEKISGGRYTRYKRRDDTAADE